MRRSPSTPQIGAVRAHRSSGWPCRAPCSSWRSCSSCACAVAAAGKWRPPVRPRPQAEGAARRGGTPDIMVMADVAGADEAKLELNETIEFLRDPAPLRPAGRLADPRRAALRAARYRQDPARQGRRGRGRRPVLLGLGLRVRREVRGGRRGPCSRACSPTPGRPGAAVVFIDEIDAMAKASGGATATRSASRPSTSSWSRWMASGPTTTSS